MTEPPAMGGFGAISSPLREAIMVKHGALSKSHVHQMLASKDARVRRAAYTLLEASNPALRRNSELFLEIIRFIWKPIRATISIESSTSAI